MNNIIDYLKNGQFVKFYQEVSSEIKRRIDNDSTIATKKQKLEKIKTIKEILNKG